MHLNLGNSVLSAVLIIYASPHLIEVRKAVIEEIKKLLDQKGIAYNSENIFWYIEKDEEIVLKEMGIYYNDYILDNLKIIEKSQQTVFIVDPEEEGFKYLKILYKMKGVLFLQRINL
jgi:hypothetical protein